MGNLSIVALIAFSCLLGGFTAGWKVNSWKNASEREAAAVAMTDALEMAAKEIAKIEVKNVTIRQEVQGKIIERVYYRDCKHEPDVMLDINRALQNKPIGPTKLPEGATATDR